MSQCPGCGFVLTRFEREEGCPKCHEDWARKMRDL